jgi:nitrous oxidase accessory protein NosD
MLAHAGALVAALLMMSLRATAQTTLYVNDATGNDAVARASNSAATPWKTIGRAAWGSTRRDAPNAAEAARAGDTVEVAAGTYSYGGTISNRWGVVYNPVNEGTGPDRAITFRATGRVTLTAPATASPVIGCYQRDYIVWQGPFELSEASISIHPDTGTVVMSGAVTGCGVDGIRVDGNGAPAYVDNHTGVRIEYCTSCFVRNSTITNVRHRRGNHNGSGVMLYDSSDALIERNHIFSVDNAVFVKGVRPNGPAQARTTIRLNLLVNCDECITLSDSRDSRIYQNVIRDSEIGLNLLARGPGPLIHPVGDWFVNNTMDNMSQACVFLGGGDWHESVRVWNNIFTNCRRVNHRETGTFGTGTAKVDWQHNGYATFGVFAADASGQYSFSQWQKTFSQDTAAPPSATTDPRFVDASRDDFRLCSGAGAPHTDCRSASGLTRMGVDILNLNAAGKTSDLIPIGAFVSNLERIGPPSQAVPAQK